jgi:hypothetical protein
MAKHRWQVYLFVLLFLSIFVLLSHSQPNLTVKEILEKNVQAAGGKEKLSQIENYSFKYRTKSFFMSSGGLMKITEGKDPIITEIVLVDQKKVKRNCYNNITEITGLQKATYQILAKLRSGLYTLTNFKGQLKLQGIKKFGPKQYYLLTTTIDDLKVGFYLDKEEFTLKRIVFQGFNKTTGKYEVNHDIGTYQEINGVKIPSSWFSSQVGTRGTMYEISDLKINQALEKDFFSALDINVGEVEIAEASLNGNIIEFMFRRNMLMIGTNWTIACTKKAGFKTKDKLILQISDEQIEIDFYETVQPRGTIAPGMKFMVPNQRSENYLIYLWSEEYRQLSEKLEPLLPIQVKRK